MGNLVPVFTSLFDDAVVAFVVLVLVDDFFGVMLSVKAKSFDVHRLPSFLLTQMGTRQAMALAGALIIAMVSGAAGSDYSGIHQAALGLITAGGGAMSLSVGKDIVLKVKAFIS